MLLAAAAFPARAGASGEEAGGVSRDRPSFSAQVSLRLGAGDSVTATLLVSIAASQLAFVREGGSFAARTEASATIRRSSAKQLFTVLDTLRATAPSYEATRADSLQLTWERGFAVRPGQYLLDVQVRDLEAGVKSKVRLELDVENLRAHDGTLSPLTVGSVRAGVDSARTLDDLVPNASRSFSREHPFTAFGGEIYAGQSAADSARAARDSTWTLVYQIVDGDRAVRLKGQRTVARRGIVTPYVLQPPLDWLTLGPYVLTIFAAPNGPERKIRFEVDDTQLDLDRDLRRVTGMISYIASHADLDSLRDAPSSAERRARWERFWKRREDTGSRNRFYITRREYFRRLRIADELYGGAEGGWRSDRGRIFIKFGPPEQVYEQPVTGYDPAYQTWQYFAPNRTFRFADRDGIGRWFLVASSGGE